VVATLTPLQRAAPKLRDEIMACMRRMRELRVPFVAGTDAGVSLLPFDSLPRELEIMVEDVGMTPLEAIHAATGRSAEILGISSVGTLEPGRYADMLVVEGDPSVRIQDVRSQRMVLLGGATVVENGVLLA
jgi:imidazolonepropionase-like amidohydrolase